MKREMQDLVQGTDEWAMFRLRHHGASEAAAMLGLSPNVKRSELLRMKHTGLPKEFSDWVQEHILDHGHKVEELARPFIEELLGEELYPVTYTYGRLSASCDGLNLDGLIAMEHKQWSESLAARMRAGEMPAEHMPQCQQVMLVTGAKRCLFVVSDGTPERMLSCWVDADPKWFDRIWRGWAQFDADLAAYELPPAAEPKPIGRAPETLPALSISVTGVVTSSNLAAFKKVALGAIGSVNRTLVTDQDFADARKSIKWCEDVESRLKAAKEHALGQTATIDELFRTMDEIAAESKKVRLELTKLDETRRAERRGEIVADALKKVQVRAADVNATLPAPWISCPRPDFGAAIKGKSSFDSMREACDVLVAEAKILIDKQAELLTKNREILVLEGRDWITLFPDFATVGIKSLEDFAALAHLRISKQIEADRVAKEAEDRKAAEAAQAAQAVATPAQPPAPAPTPAAPQRTFGGGGFSRPAPAPPAANEAPTLRLGDICTRLGFVVTGSFVADTLGIPFSATPQGAKLYRESDYPRIVRAIQRHLDGLLEPQPAAA